MYANTCFLSALFLTFILTGNCSTVYKGHPPHMVGDGFRVRNYFAASEDPPELFSPFLLLDYNEPYSFPPSKRQRGVGAHPHRGFETVTIIYQGAVAHRDSNGGGGVVGPGDVQWMTAGSGVLHEEFHEKAFAKKGGVLHAVQLWVNLPAQYKMSPPKYQTLLSTDMGICQFDEKGSYGRVIAGNLNGVRGPAQTFTPIELYDLRLKEGAKVTFSLPHKQNTLLLITGGEIRVNQNTKASFKDLVKMSDQRVEIEALKESMILVLSGDPIDEPVVQTGPFAMNTQEEIDQAYRDLKAGKFGHL